MVAATAAFGDVLGAGDVAAVGGAEAVGAHQGLAFGLVNLAWAVGMVGGAAGGGALAKATSDTLCYASWRCCARRRWRRSRGGAASRAIPTSVS